MSTVGSRMGQAAGSLSAAARSAKNAIKAPFKPRNIQTQGLSNFTEGFRAAKGKTPFGQNYAEGAVQREAARRAQQGLPQMTPSEHFNTANDALQKATERAQRVRDLKNKPKGPSFAARHPVLTGVAAYGAMQAALGGGNDPQPQTPPPVVYSGNQYY